MEIRGRLVGVVRDVMSGHYHITFSCDELPTDLNDLKDRILRITVKIFRKRRSLDANGYAWALCGEIANVLRISKEEAYIERIGDYGQPRIIDGFADIAPYPEDVDMSKNNKVNKQGVYYFPYARGVIDDIPVIWWVTMRGSHDYDTREMSIFIDGIVEDAKELGIDTIPKVELDRLKEKWHL